ncbi:MAG: hypothetical protein J6W23_07100 [Victivallales bacterium]|nr:hypothetical protein [Victivallales bacterium]
MKMNMKRFSSVTKAARIAVLALPWLVTAAMAEPAAEGAVVAAGTGDYATIAKYIAIALIMICGSMAASMAVSKVGSAAMGAAAEKPEVLSKAIIYVGLGEGIALFGFLIALFMLNK